MRPQNAKFVLVAGPHSGPRRAERAKKILRTSQGRSSVGIGTSRASPWLVEAVQKVLRNMLQAAADGCVGQFRERGPPIAVPCKLGIEWDGPEAGNLQARWPALSGIEGFRLR